MSAEVWGLEGFEPRDHFTARHRRSFDAIRYVVGKVATAPALGATCSRERHGGVPLRWVDMTAMFGRKGAWDEVRGILMGRGLLVRDGVYTIGEKAMWYELGPSLWGGKAELVKLRDVHHLGRVEEQDDVEQEYPRWQGAPGHIERWLGETTVDPEMTAKVVACRTHSLSAHHAALKVEAINGRRPRIMQCPYGRLHSPVVNLSRAIRPGLRIAGELLAECDTKNCQPLIIGFLVSKVISGEWSIDLVRAMGQEKEKGQFGGYHAITGATGPKMNASRQTATGEGGEDNTHAQTRAHTQCPPIFPARMSAFTSDLILSPCMGAFPADLADYMHACETGTFYQALADIWGVPNATREEQDHVKGLAFKHVLFGRARGLRWEAVRGRWPTVADVLEQIKLGDHGIAARACQVVESSLMIGGVVGKFQADHPDVPIQTIHDAVLVPVDAVDLAKEIIFEVFGAIGLSPGIKVKLPE